MLHDKFEGDAKIQTFFSLQSLGKVAKIISTAADRLSRSCRITESELARLWLLV